MNKFHSIITLVLFISLIGCESKPSFPEIEGKDYEGYLSYKIRNSKELPADVVSMLDSLEEEGTLNPFQKKALEVQRTIEKYGLANFNTFYVQLDSIGVVKAYAPESAYSKIDTLTLEHLIRTLQRAKIEFSGMIENDIMLVDEIKTVSFEEGKTLWQR